MLDPRAPSQQPQGAGTTTGVSCGVPGPQRKRGHIPRPLTHTALRWASSLGFFLILATAPGKSFLTALLYSLPVPADTPAAHWTRPYSHAWRITLVGLMPTCGGTWFQNLRSCFGNEESQGKGESHVLSSDPIPDYIQQVE